MGVTAPDESENTVGAPILPTATEKVAALHVAAVRIDEQRKINLTWEITQAVVAVVLTTGVMIIAGILLVRDDVHAAEALLLLSNAFFMIITQYFTRTNHTKNGGMRKEDGVP